MRPFVFPGAGEEDFLVDYTDGRRSKLQEQCSFLFSGQNRTNKKADVSSKEGWEAVCPAQGTTLTQSVLI
jgi:hypothetical protein